jgi:hypothetical protein
MSYTPLTDAELAALKTDSPLRIRCDQETYNLIARRVEAAMMPRLVPPAEPKRAVDMMQEPPWTRETRSTGERVEHNAEAARHGAVVALRALSEVLDVIRGGPLSVTPGVPRSETFTLNVDGLTAARLEQAERFAREQLTALPLTSLDRVSHVFPVGCHVIIQDTVDRSVHSSIAGDPYRDKNGLIVLCTTAGDYPMHRVFSRAAVQL